MESFTWFSSLISGKLETKDEPKISQDTFFVIPTLQFPLPFTEHFYGGSVVYEAGET